jgi:hypothetical protein
MVAAVALSRIAAMPTKAIATMAYNSAEANASTIPRHQVSPVAIR